MSKESDIALRALMNDDPDDEPDTGNAALDDDQGQVLNGADGDDSEHQLESESEPDWLELDDDDLDTKFKYGDDFVTPRDWLSVRERAAAPEYIEQERAQIEAERAELQRERESYQWLNDIDVPHVAVRGLFNDLYERGGIPAELYNDYVRPALQEAIKAGLYDPNTAANQAEIARAKREVEKERASIEDERRSARVQSEIAQVKQQHGVDLTTDQAAAKKVLDYIKSEYARNPKNILSLNDAAAALSKKGAFASPPPTRRALAEKYQSKKKPKTSSLNTKTTYEQALRNLMEA